MARSSDSQRLRHNVAVHDRLAERYERIHGDIFNPIEQQRLRRSLARAAELLDAGAAKPLALDVGCGIGNLTAHLVALGMEVLAADVSRRSLAVVEGKFAGRGVRTLLLNGRDLAGVETASVDLAAAYSVLHHVDDYLALVGEMARVVRPGGVVYIDHEHCPSHWADPDRYARYVRLARPPWYHIERWRKFLAPENYLARLRRLRDPRHAVEGDLHVWPDDHVRWSAVEAALADAGCRVAWTEDYLLYRRGWRRDVYERHRLELKEMRALAAVKT